MVVNISKDSEENFSQLSSSGLITQILEELDSNDVLLRMNIVELLIQLGLSRHGYNYLEQNGILSKLFAFIDDNEDPVIVQLCEPGKKCSDFLLNLNFTYCGYVCKNL